MQNLQNTIIAEKKELSDCLKIWKLAVCIKTEKYWSVLSQSLNQPLVISNLWEGEKSHGCAASMFSFFSILPQGLWTYLNKTSSNSAALFTNSVRRQKEKIQFSTEEWYTFFFHILFETWQEQNIPRESDRAQLPAMYTCPCFLNYLLSAVPALKKAESVLYVPSYDSYKTIPRVWFSQLFFNALLVCPLISPLVWVCLSNNKKIYIQLDLWQLCQRNQWHFL